MVRQTTRMLVADDHAQYRAAITDLLSLFDEIDVVAQANSVSDAFRALAETPIDVVLLDVRMPGVDGISGAKAMLDSYPRLHVMLCSTADRQDLRPFQLSDRLTFVSKADLDPEALIAWCRSWQ
jgi:two-component system, NarL family, invasion response regulator UvrY